MDFYYDFCHEKERLFQRYSESLQAFAKAIGHLSRGVDRSTHIQIVSETREARETTEEAKGAYSRHVADHGC
jgi:hypothetical protein